MPVPVFARAIVPLVFWMTPEKVLLALPLPTVSVDLPAAGKVVDGPRAGERTHADAVAVQVERDAAGDRRVRWPHPTPRRCRVAACRR